MKISSKSIFVLFLMSLSVASFAQGITIKAGANFANIKISDDEESETFDTKIGPLFGATIALPISELFSFEPGLLVSSKGFKLEDSFDFIGTTTDIKSTLQLLYLEIPLNVKAKFNVGNTKIYGSFGPYIGIGISGKSTSEVTVQGQTEKDEEDVNWGSDEEKDDVNRLDFGLSIGAGIELNTFEIGLFYSLGLANISPEDEDGFKAINRVFGISVGYKLSKK